MTQYNIEAAAGKFADRNQLETDELLAEWWKQIEGNLRLGLKQFSLSIAHGTTQLAVTLALYQLRNENAGGPWTIADPVPADEAQKAEGKRWMVRIERHMTGTERLLAAENTYRAENWPRL
jgi:hypothetical protein